MIQALLGAGRPILADGAWATQLAARGYPAGVPAETANIDGPDAVAALCKAYVDAGARILTTNTFAANRNVFARRKVEHSVADVVKAGAEIALRAADDSKAAVAGSVGPSGRIMAVGEVREEEVAAILLEPIRALAASGVHALVLETFSELAEILLALRVARQVCALPVIASMSFDSGPQRTRTNMGAEAGHCAMALEEGGADLIGCNCGGGAATALPSVVALRAATTQPVWAKPSAGLPEFEDGAFVYKLAPEEFAAYAARLVDAGANVVGGCCGVGPEHIRRAAMVLK